MCGIVGAVAGRDILPILLQGLKRLEYRGYDSSGVAIVLGTGELARVRAAGRVEILEALLTEKPLSGGLGIAHTRWATHGIPAEHNAHPHISKDGLALVHNGIIENHEKLREWLRQKGYLFSSDTDTEVIVHLVHFHLQENNVLAKAVHKATKDLRGAYALAVIQEGEPDMLVVARRSCSVIIGLGKNENFVASDVSALLPITKDFIFLEDGDIAEIKRSGVTIIDHNELCVQRDVVTSELTAADVGKGDYAHFMLKEIHEQPAAIARTIKECVVENKLLESAFGTMAPKVFGRVKAVTIVACGTSYHAGLVARHWIEELCRLPCTVETASEFRYRIPVVIDGTLFITISQSGETADTLAALRLAKDLGYISQLAVCNVRESALVRESSLALVTRAGPEIGVASTKAFTTQLVALGLLVIALGRHRGLTSKHETALIACLAELPQFTEQVLSLSAEIAQLAQQLVDSSHALFLGRGDLAPIAAEGALKLKEISYIHAEAYPAGELKHGPLALVDNDMPVIVVAPNNKLTDKLKGNIQEVHAREGKLYVFADPGVELPAMGVTIIRMPRQGRAFQQPILYVLPLQLLAYHVALLKGADVDKPRNLAKSVTVS